MGSPHPRSFGNWSTSSGNAETSARGRRSRPAIVLTIQPSRRLLIAWLVWCAALSAALLWGSGWQVALRGYALAGLVGWTIAGARVLCLRDSRAVGGLECDRNGRWRLLDGDRCLHYVYRDGPAWALGPLIWMRFRAVNRRFAALIDGRYVEPAAFRALKGMLLLEKRRWRSHVANER